MKIPITILLLLIGEISAAQEIPRIALNTDCLGQIRKELTAYPLFEKSLQRSIQEVDAEIKTGVIVPVPRDMAGGYSHERHKRNFIILRKSGLLYQLTGKEKYAAYVKDHLMAYASIYKDLPLHPSTKSYAPGKLFWQCLNDANWLVYVSQAYASIYDYLEMDEIKYLESELFVPFANFLSRGNPRFFNRVHNHSTWANAAVGMIALAMNNEELLERALYGLEHDGIPESAMDNDGGFIKKEGVRQAGFFAQLDYSFSPDGYFTEGPYYLRYAIYPFLVFGYALEMHKPELGIFEYRDSILVKAVDALIQLSDNRGQFFPVNDAQKGMSLESRELVTAVDMIYSFFPEKKGLLSIAKNQGRVMLNECGFQVAKDLHLGKARPYEKKSVIYSDGNDGSRGGIAVLRSGNNTLAFKYSAQGMGHGHFDKLSYSLYNNEGEVIQDYGAVRWVNIDQKGGGRYLEENRSFGKQTVAHNTLVVNEVSHYKADVKTGEKFSPSVYYADLEDESVQLVAAIDSHAYENVILHRALMMIEAETFPQSLMLDIFRASSDSPQQYDLPFWYVGHLMETNCNVEKELNQLGVMGAAYGYQHIWKEGHATVRDSLIRFNWLGNGNFYTLHSVVTPGDQLLFGRAGANDPEFNLRPDPVFMIRKSDAEEAAFVTLIETHGTYDPVSEIPSTPYSHISGLRVAFQNEDYIVVDFEHDGTTRWRLQYCFNDNNESAVHQLFIDGEHTSWQGVYKLIQIQ